MISNGIKYKFKQTTVRDASKTNKFKENLE